MISSKVKLISLICISIFVLISGCTLFKVSKEKKTDEVTQESLTEDLLESRERMGIVKSEFYNGKYHGTLPIDDAIKIISEEIEIQKIIYKKYNLLPKESKTDKRIYMIFFNLGKYGWAPEMSILNALKRSK